MDDTDSIAANVDITPPPVQIQQLATFFWNILNNDRDANMAILERLEDPDDDLTRHPVQIFSAADLAHLASHLAESTRTVLAYCQIKPFEWRHFQTSAIEPAHPGVLSCRNNSAADFFPVF